ncbi:MAG: tetratricopeptide repeat protein [FCB group bacterium]|nr:tetratricopeptide repeat protein [FCB group bacterium]
MKLKTSQQIKQATDLFLNKEYERSIATIEEIDLNELPLKEQAFGNLLFCHASLHVGIYDIEDELEAAYKYYRNSSDNDKYALVKYLQAWRLLSIGNHFDAREVLIESYAAYKRCEDLKGQATILNELAFTAFQLGEVTHAVRYLRDCIKLYKQLNDRPNATLISMNLALLFYSLGNLHDSKHEYAGIAKAILDQGAKNCAIYFSHHAIPYALLGEIDTAEEMIAKAVPYLDGFVREQAIYHENMGWIYLLDEEYEKAEKELLKGLKISLEIAPQSALIPQIKRRLADACLGQDREEEARRYADEALIVAEKIGEKVEIAACQRVYARLESLAGNMKKARVLFEQAIDTFALIGSRYELAATRYLAAVSGQYDNGQRQALLYTARQYFTEEKVTPYLKKIAAAFKSTPATFPFKKRQDSAPVIVAVDPRVKQLVDLAENIAPSNMSVLLTGATGTGKDLMAEYIHFCSDRRGEFVMVNCPALSEQLFESELFGHVRGAYTNANKDRGGRLAKADKGTLFLNEIGDLPLPLQAKILTAIETGRYEKVGSDQTVAVDCRIIAATNHDIEERVSEGFFRPDLFHRINEVRIDLPALDERREDMLELTRYFLGLYGVKVNGDEETLGDLTDVLAGRVWLGNIRQLKTEVKRLALIGEGDLAQMVIEASHNGESDAETLRRLLDQFDWNRRDVARALGVSEGTVRNRIRKYKISD